jgi:glycosyltransferase involved in cell wall biosynthesis
VSAAAKPARVVTMLDSIRALGGAETIAVGTAKALDPERFERWLCVTRWDEAWLDIPQVRALRTELDRSGVRFLGLERGSRASISPWRHLHRLLRTERIDVLHSHMFGSNVWASLIGPAARVPVVVAHEHNWSFTGNPGRSLVDRFVIGRRADAVVTVSTHARERMVNDERIPADRVRLIRNGVPDLPTRERTPEIRSTLGIPAGALVIGSVGLLRREKAFEILVDAAARLKGAGVDAYVVIAGEGPERGRLQAALDATGLGERLQLLGHRDDVPQLLSSLDIAVCCSDFEGGPLSVMEYLAAGLPVVATRTGGLPELVGDGENGLLVPTRDAGALAKALAALAGEPELRARLGNESRRRFEDDLGFPAYVARVEALYDELLAARTSS